MQKKLPFTNDELLNIVNKYETPFHLYDEKGIIESARTLINAFSWAPNFKEYFAVKATPNPSILKILKNEGCGTDCSSMAELVLSQKVDIIGENIMFSSNDTPASEFKKAKELNAIINLDDISHISFLENHAGLPEILCFRYNPGAAREGNAIIGNPQEAKYGFTKEQLFEGYKYIKEKGVKRFGLHTMVASNELNEYYFVETAIMLFDLAVEIYKQLDIKLEFINLGGGIGIPYKPDQKPVDINLISSEIQKEYNKKIKANGINSKIFFECGRVITGPNGFLVSKVLHFKKIYKNYIGLDACMANLMRPALYGAYHHITVIGKDDKPKTFLYDVVGSLCENNDKFAIDRYLPEINIGDIVVIHDAGAHGHAMGFNYNGKLRSAELLLKTDGSVEMIRRKETLNDYFSTLDF